MGHVLPHTRNFRPEHPGRGLQIFPVQNIREVA